MGTTNQNLFYDKSFSKDNSIQELGHNINKVELFKENKPDGQTNTNKGKSKVINVSEKLKKKIPKSPKLKNVKAESNNLVPIYGFHVSQSLIDNKNISKKKLLNYITKNHSPEQTMNFQKKFKKEKSIENSVINLYNQLKPDANNHSIFDEDLEELFKKYKPLDDGNKVEVRNKVLFKDKSIYLGEWIINSKIRHGRGIIIWADGRRYEGQWKFNKVHGKGKLVHSNGDVYEGDWVNNKPNGKGCFIHKEGNKYEGEWKDDKQNGEGKETWTDGSYYIGTYKDNKKDGHGHFFWTNGTNYEGNFCEDVMSGKGKCIFFDGRVYEGEWANNMFEGKGIYTWPDGRKYVGEYKNNKKEGFGEFRWSDGRIYKGFWKGGKQHGQGEFFSPKEQKWLKGEWNYGKIVRWLENFK